jgi:hypothetical protein
MYNNATIPLLALRHRWQRPLSVSHRLLTPNGLLDALTQISDPMPSYR